MKSLELRWGLIIGAANLLWLYGSYFAGLHTNGLAAIQVMSLVSLLITFVGYLLALRAVQNAQPEITWKEGVKSGAMIAGIVAAIAVLTQVGYFTLIHPEWPDYMAEETRKFYEAQNVPEDQIGPLVEGSRKAFGLRSYTLQAGVGAIVFGMIFSMIIMAFLRRGRKV